jgi:hypothetical protein
MDYLSFSTQAQIECYAEALIDRLRWQRGVAPEMHLEEPMEGEPTRPIRKTFSLPPPPKDWK